MCDDEMTKMDGRIAVASGASNVDIMSGFRPPPELQAR